MRLEAGNQRYRVGIDTPKVCATSMGGVPATNSFLAAWTLLSVIWRFAAAKPFRVRSMMSSRSIWARFAIT